MKLQQTPESLPIFVKEISGDVQPDYWKPQTLAEWVEFQETTVLLGAWGRQLALERSLRKMVGIWVFVLITFQVVGIFAFVVLDATKLIALDTSIIKLLIPSVLAEVFGMGLVVVKYLFGPSTRIPFKGTDRK